MVAAILSMLGVLLPTIIKIVGYLIDKKKNSDDLKVEFLKFVASIEKDMPIKLRKDYLDQIAQVKEQLQLEETKKTTLVEEHANYKESYEKLLLEHEALKCQLSKK
jgi:uncharacterized membrane protein YgaE (UPF0421/DUF939 family)